METEQQYTNFKDNMLKVGQESFVPPENFYKNHRDLLIKNLKETIQCPPNSVLFFQGVPTIPIDDTDTEIWVEQESNFFYLFGVEEPDCFGAIEMDTGKTTIFHQELPEIYKMWMVVKDSQDFKNQYKVEQVLHNSQIAEYIQNLKPGTVYLYDGIDADSGLRPRLPELKNFEGFTVEKESLYNVLNEQRTVKDETELDIMRFITRVSADAHVNVIRNVKPGIRQSQMEALFRYYMQERIGSKHKSYECICASGTHNATLHYQINDKIVEDGQLILNDMGSKYNGYCSDITSSFPSNGKFTEKQKEIYNAVLDANLAVQKQMGDGVAWDDMHRLSENRILTHLQQLGLVVSDVPVEELVEKRVGAVFQPHGLGHFIGLRVHDVGGYNKGCPERHTLPGLKSLRTRRVLKKHNCITIEPGCYFIDFILENAFKDPELSKYLVKEKINEYRHVGGVRIEDDVIVLQQGCENMSIVPRTVEQIELCMAGKEWRNVKSQ